MGHKSIARQISLYGRVNVPLLRHRHCHRFGAIFLHHPRKHLLIFERIVGASAVDEQAAGAQGIPHVGNDATLQIGALLHQCRRPLAARLFIFAHHTLAATGHIGSHHIEEMRKASKVVGRIAGNHTARGAPLLQIFA